LAKSSQSKKKERATFWKVCLGLKFSHQWECFSQQIVWLFLKKFGQIFKNKNVSLIYTERFETKTALKMKLLLFLK
jgi:hypothetical protein